MVDEATSSTVEGKIAALHQKVEREARFTRSLLVICTAAVLGVSLVPVKIMLADLPTIMWADFMTKLDTVHDQWAVLDKTMDARHSGKGGTQDAAATPAPEGETK